MSHRERWRHGPTEDETDVRVPIEDARPPNAWIEAFRQQCTPELWDAALRYAKHRIGVVRGVRVADDDYDACELVQNALGDTFEGTLRWDLTRPLLTHVCLVILTRTNHEWERARKFRHESLDVHADDDEPLAGQVQAALRDGAPSNNPDSAILHRQRWAELRRQAEHHPAAMAILNAVAEKAETREGIMRVAQLSNDDHHAGYMHLLRMARGPARTRATKARKKGRTR